MKIKKVTVLLPGLILLLTSVTTSLSFLTNKAYAAAPYIASDVLGQTDPFSGQPSFTTKKYNMEGISSASLNTARNVEVDSVNHRLFIADSNNYRVVVHNLNSSNQMIDIFADNVLGQPDFTTAVQNTNIKGFSSPQDLLYDAGSNLLYVVDSNRVMVFDVSTITNNEDAIYVLGQADFITNTNHTNIKGFWGAKSLALDGDNDRLFVSDQNNDRVMVFDVSTITNNEDAIYVLGQADFNTGTNDTNAKGFYEVTGVAFDVSTELLYVSDLFNNRILVFDTASLANNMDASYVLGQSDFITEGNDTNVKGFYQADSLDIDASEQLLYVADSWNNRVLVFDVSSLSNNMDASYVLGQPDFNTSLADTNTKGFDFPMGLAIDPVNDQLFVADWFNERILAFDVVDITNNEDAVSVIGQYDEDGNPSFVTDVPGSISSPNNLGFYEPADTVLDEIDHRLFVMDSGNYRVLVFNLDSTNQLIDHRADYVLGQPDMGSDDSDATASAFSTLYAGLAYDHASKRLFVQDGYDNNRVLIFDLSSGITNGMDASWVLGQDDFVSTDSGTDVSSFYSPYGGGLSYDPVNDRLFVNDGYNNSRILIFDLSSGITNGMDASWVLGQDDFESTDTDTAVNRFDYLYSGMVYDPTNSRLYVSDGYSNNRIMIFDLSSGITNGMDASWVLGQPDFETADWPDPGPASFYYPGALALDTNNQKLYVSDNSTNYRTLVFDVSEISNGEDAVAVLGQVDFESSDWSDPPTASSQYGTEIASAMAFDSVNKRLYLPDTDNNRILIYNLPNLTLGDGTDTPATIPNATFGVPYDYELPIDGTQGTVTCELTDGTLPQGMSITSDCHIKGTPASNTVYTFTVTVTDDNGAIGTFSDSQVLGLTVNHASGGELIDTGSNLILPVLASVGAVTTAVVATNRRRHSSSKKR